MKKIIKFPIMLASLITITGLTACQNTPAPSATDTPKLPRHDHPHFNGKHDGMRKEWKKLTQEERDALKVKMQNKQAERKAERDILQKACVDKVGQNISVKINDKTIEGRCEVFFKPKYPEQQFKKEYREPTVSKSDV